MRRIKKTISVLLTAAIMATMSGCGNVAVKDKTTESASNVDKKDDTIKKGETYEVEKKAYKAGNLLDTVEGDSITVKTLDEEFVLSASEFSINLLKESTRNDLKAGKNVLISPDSVMNCLALAANGAGDDTLSEMEKVMCPGLTLDKFNDYLYSYNKLKTEQNDVIFNNANSIWIRNDEERIKVKEDYLKRIKTYYDASVYKEDFNAETVKKINDWVMGETNNMIDGIIDSIDPYTVIYLINAIAFEGKWANEYEERDIHENEKFTDVNKVEQKVTMLTSTESFYMEDENSKAFLKYYKGCDYAFMGILPNEGISVADYIEGLSGEKFNKLINDRSNHYNTDVFVTMPEFTFDYDILLNDSLMELGMKTPFVESANFKALAETQTDNLYISEVFHKTHIELDRNGTKAAAVTEIQMTDAECAVEERTVKDIKLDRPFVYAIVDVQTGLPIFMGALNTIE